nr:D-2-hydroxyacid dehydrogenase [Lachnospiraceae bacterium]
VLGTGDIGTTFAKRVKAFEPAEIIGVSRSGRHVDPVYDKVLAIGELDKILTKTELLVMSLPGTAETEGILSRKRIEMLPEGAFVVNVGRGTAVDYDALMDNLNNDKLGGAALDVFKTEPIPEGSPLWKTKNLLITPHSAGNLTLEYTLNKNVHQFCENLLNYVKGDPLQHRVDKTIGY